MTSFYSSADPHSWDVHVDGTHVGFLQNYNGDWTFTAWRTGFHVSIAAINDKIKEVEVKGD